MNLIEHLAAQPQHLTADTVDLGPADAELLADLVGVGARHLGDVSFYAPIQGRAQRIERTRVTVPEPIRTWAAACVTALSVARAADDAARAVREETRARARQWYLDTWVAAHVDRTWVSAVGQCFGVRGHAVLRDGQHFVSRIVPFGMGSTAVQLAVASAYAPVLARWAAEQEAKRLQRAERDAGVAA